jgi:hypothetical protein
MTRHGLHMTLVVHPGWDIAHPLEHDGRAVRLWPPSGAIDLTVLPSLPRRTIAWVRCRVVLRDGVMGLSMLPPLGPSTLPFGVVPELTPYVSAWGV